MAARLATSTAYSLFLVAFSATAFAQPDLVSSDSGGAPLPVDGVAPFSYPGYQALDVSADGRYVLLSNYPVGGFGLDANTGYPVYPDNCQILRKDRQTGTLVTAFASAPGDFEFCNGAKISADGHIVVASPAGSQVSCTEGGEVTALIARNLATGADTEISTTWTPPAGDSSRLCYGPDATLQYPGQAVHSINSAGNFALLSNYAVLGGVTQPIFDLVDIRAGTIEAVALEIEEGASPWIKGVALSEDGMQLAVNAVIYSPYLPDESGSTGPDASQPTGPSGALVCGQDGRCSLLNIPPAGGDSWWAFGYEPVPRELPPSNIYIIDRVAGTQSVPDALTNLPDGTTLQTNAWSADGRRLSFLEAPQFILGCYVADENGTTECFPADTCAGADCELTVHHYAFAAATLNSYRTDYDPDTLSLCRPTADSDSTGIVTNINCMPRLSRDGNRLLYARAVAHPFGGDWLPNPLASDNFRCVTRESLATPGSDPVFIECPSIDLGGGQQGPGLPGPIGGYPGQLPVNGFNPLGGYFQNTGVTASILPEPCLAYPTCTAYPFYWASAAYHAPVNWYVRDLRTGHTSLVSVTGKGQLFQSNGTLFSDNGSTVIFKSQDPRLQNADPAALAATEAALDAACFWSPAGSRSTLRVATNDNTRFVAEDEFNVYRATPVFCPVPDPALTAHIFGVDLSGGVNLAVMTFRRGWGRTPGDMQTWIGNFSRGNATMAVLNIEVSGLGNNGNVRFGNEACDIYPADDNATDDSMLVRCEFPALARGEFKQLRWTMTGDMPAFVTVKSTIAANENELRPQNNTDVDRVALWPRRPFFGWLQNLR